MVAFSDAAALGPRATSEPASPDEPGREAVTNWGAEEFRAIYEEHFKQVWCSLRRLGVREADLMDLTQKVFLTAYTRLHTFEGRARLSTWLYAICQRLASDYRRSAVVRREVATDASEIDLAVPADDSSAAVATRQRARLAEAILDKLPEAQRTVFVLFELEELSGPEIAAILDVSLGTVRSRLRLARESFAREVKRLSAIRHSEEQGR